MKTDSLIIYRGLLKDRLFNEMARIAEASYIPENAGELKEQTEREKTGRPGTGGGFTGLISSFVGGLLEKAGELGLSGNIRREYLTWLLIRQENAWTLEIESEKTVQTCTGLLNAVYRDMEIIREIFDTEPGTGEMPGSEYMIMLTNYVNQSRRTRLLPPEALKRISELSSELERAGSSEEFAAALAGYHSRFGAGDFGLFKAFRIAETPEGPVLKPVMNTDPVRLDDLVGYELQKQKLKENTEAFINRRKANNCLLFGAAGTGKSSSIKGILNEYSDRGLRMVELYKNGLKNLSPVMEKLCRRDYRFIIYMDDLSFEDFETEYKYLKAVIEGGLEKKPENVLIYATSNRRHLIRESFSDREEGENDLHKNDTVQEKLSLAYRFGVSIYFGSPDKKEFNNIVKTLAKRYNIDMPEEDLIAEANRWELSHGGLSGRTAQAFIDYLSGIGAD